MEDEWSEIKDDCHFFVLNPVKATWILRKTIIHLIGWLAFLKSIYVKSKTEVTALELENFTIRIIKIDFWYWHRFSEILKFFSPENHFVEIFHCLYPEFTFFFSPILCIFIGSYIPFVIYYKSFVALFSFLHFRYVKCDFSVSGSSSVSVFQKWDLGFCFVMIGSFIPTRPGSFLSVFWSCSAVLKNIAMNLCHICRTKMVFSHWVLNTLDFRELSLSLKL